MNAPDEDARPYLRALSEQASDLMAMSIEGGRSMTVSKTIRPGFDDDVWRDDEGTTWIRQQQLIDAVKFNVDRFRAVIENAPHAWDCQQETYDGHDETRPCTCWKAGVL